MNNIINSAFKGGLPAGGDNSGLHLLLIALLSIGLYFNTLFNDYAQDDAIVITENMFTKQGIKGIGGILSNDTFYGFFKKRGKAKLVEGGRYRPLSLVTFALEYELFGENPFTGHLFNIILFTILALILYKVLVLIFENTKYSKIRHLLAFISVLIYVAHPVHTEVVANIKGRDEILAMLFSILALYQSVKWYHKRKIINIVFVFIFYLLALFSKENAITFLGIVPLTFMAFFQIKKKDYLFIMMPLLAATVIFLAVRISILGLDFGNKSLELMNNPFVKIEGGKYVFYSTGEKFATILYTLGKYLLLLVFPHPLTNDYYPRQIPLVQPWDWRVLLSFAVYLLLLVTAIKMWKKERIVSFSIFYYFITLSIVSNIVFNVGTNMSERFLFMPSLGFSVLAAFLLIKLKERKPALATGLIAVVLVLYGIKTIARNRVWKDDYTLFTTDVKVSSNSAKALNAAAGAIVNRYYEDNLKNKKSLLQAERYIEEALKIHPNYKNAWLIRGNIEYYLGKYVDAIDAYEKVLQLDKNNEDALKNIAFAYRDAGKYYGEKKNDLQKALQYLKKAYELMPDDYETIRLYGIANALSSNHQKAIELFTKAVKLQPGNAGAYLNLGNAYHNAGDIEKGEYYRNKAKELDPQIFNK